MTLTSAKPRARVVRDGKLGRYLVAISNIAEGDKIIEEKAHLQDYPNTHSIQYNTDKHAHMRQEGMLKFTQHLCAPNCIVMFEKSSLPNIEDDQVLVTLVALKDIASGESIGFNYSTSDWKLSSPFECYCGAASCVQSIRGFAYLEPAQQSALVELVRGNILDAIASNWNDDVCGA